MCLHIFFQKFRDRVIIGHHHHLFFQFVWCNKMVFLLAAWSMPAAVGCVLRSIIGLAAAGITEF
jgi:hypothetical protein